MNNRSIDIIDDSIRLSSICCYFSRDKMPQSSRCRSTVTSCAGAVYLGQRNARGGEHVRVSGWLYLGQQFLCGFCLLLALGHAAGLGRRSRTRLIITSLLTALGALIAARSGMVWLRVAMLIPLLLLAPFAAWPGVPRRLRWHLSLLHGLLGLALAGWSRLMQSLGVWQSMIVPFACALMCAVTPLLRRTDHPRCVTVEIRHNGHRLTLTALIDSGNLLRDPVTALPVIVISRRAAARLTLLPQPGHLTPGMRLLSVHTIAGTTLMAVFRPSAVFLEEHGAWRAVNAIIGLSPDGYEGFQALVPSSLAQPLSTDVQPAASEVSDALAGIPDP